ncbi:autophagy-related protein 22-like protein [Geopyxis carbonaria]|nr:autophagy-related protein 22-like protein [Geopyxis carbonaria]
MVAAVSSSSSQTTYGACHPVPSTASATTTMGKPAADALPDDVDPAVAANLARYERLFAATEDAYPQPTTTRRELWSYYLYYNGDNGVGPLSYSQALFQSTLTAAGHVPGTSPPAKCSASSACVVAGRSVAGMVLLANGVCFAAMTVLFITLGSVADYGKSGGRWMLAVCTAVCWACQFGFMGVRASGGRWGAAMALFCGSFVSYGATLVFYAAVFPRLARYMPEVRKVRGEFEEGVEGVTRERCEEVESLERSHISSVSTAHSNVGYLCTLALNLSVLLPLEGHEYANNLALLLTTVYWVVLGLPWFVLQQPRPGPRLPAGSSYFTIGWKQAALALRESMRLPQTFLYLIAYFLLSDGLNTTGTLVSIVQNQQIEFSFLALTYLGLTQAVCSIASTLGCWYLQRYFKISSKAMFVFTNVFSVVIPVWGMVGLWTDKIGLHNRWEFYAYNVVFGLTQAPYYAYAQTMMSELTPRGYEGLFFGLFGLTNRASSIIGPNVVQAIVESADGNTWMGFPFLVALCGAAAVTVWFVDVEKGRDDGRQWAEKRKVVMVARAVGVEADEVVNSAREGRNLGESTGVEVS